MPLDAIFCPKCGARILSHNQPSQNNKVQPKKPIYKRFWFWFIVICIIIGGVLSNFEEEEKSDDPDATTQTDENEQKNPEKLLPFLDDFTEYGYSAKQIEDMRTILTNVGITEITDLEVGNVVSGMQVVEGIIYKDPVYQSTGKEVQVQFNIENGVIYLVAIYCPSYSAANQPTYLSGLTNRRADLYYDVEGGYLKKIDWESKAVVDY